MLASRSLAPRKSLGQCFLIDGNLADKLLDRSGARATDVVLEIGPGAGALTEGLLARGCTVVACEIDAGLADLLADRFASEIDAGQLTLLRGDCLDRSGALAQPAIQALGEAPFRLVANLPYAAGTPLLLTLLLNHPKCSGMYVTVQQEVAQRLRSAPGNKTYGIISVIAQALAQLERVATLSPQCFWPSPKVKSEMLAIERLDKPLTDDPQALAATARLLFGHRRKQIGTIIGSAAALPDDVNARNRPEQLSVAQFVAMSLPGGTGL